MGSQSMPHPQQELQWVKHTNRREFLSQSLLIEKGCKIFFPVNLSPNVFPMWGKHAQKKIYIYSDKPREIINSGVYTANIYLLNVLLNFYTSPLILTKNSFQSVRIGSDYFEVFTQRVFGITTWLVILFSLLVEY